MKLNIHFDGEDIYCFECNKIGLKQQDELNLFNSYRNRTTFIIICKDCIDTITANIH